MIEDLKKANALISRAIKDFEETPEKEVISILMETLQDIDLYYKELCNCDDAQWGEKPGTTYEKGCSSEFYIDSSDWHKVSLALRKLD